MCGRVVVPEPDDSPEALARLYTQLEERRKQKEPGFFMKRGELKPGDTLAVLAPDKQMKKNVFAMKWGFLLPKPQTPFGGQQLRMEDILPQEEATPKGKLVFNARSESATSRPLFADSLRQRRCLIPAMGYYEWDHHDSAMTKYLFRLKDDEPLWLAGLYRIRDAQAEFAILTRQAEGGAEQFHDRMPVICPPQMTESWLDPTAPPSLVLTQAVTDICWQSLG